MQRNRTEPKEIRALVRGAQVIETLCRVGAGSLADLHRSTKLPKATLRRILITYQRMNFIRCSLGDGLYRPNIHIPAYAYTAANPFVGRVVSAAADVMRELAANVGWPSDLLVREGTRLRVVETNRSLISIQISPLEIGDHVEMPSSAVGRVYLAFCPKSERDEIIQDIARLGGKTMISGLHRVLEETRARGYGERDPKFTGGTGRYPLLADKFAAIAVPVMSRNLVVCCINLLWARSARGSIRSVVAMAETLKDGAREIAKNYDLHQELDKANLL